MKFEFFIAKRFLGSNKKTFSKPIINIAIASIALGLAVMIISLSVLRGFQREITEKIVGFGSHIQIRNFEASNSLEIQPVDKSSPFIRRLHTIPGIRNIQASASIGGMIKTDEQIQGVILKGLESGCDTSFLCKNMIQGRFIQWTNDSTPSKEIVISSYIASKLKLKLADKLKVYFLVDDNLRTRAFDIVGIYNTGLLTFDERFVIGDIKQVQRLHKWNENQAEMIEVSISDFSQMKRMTEVVYNEIGYDLTLTTITELYPALFSWLKLLDTNTIVIFTVMVLVALVTILSTLLIIIFEKTFTIGVLKTLGATNNSIRKIFLIKAGFIIARGILYGASLAVLLCILQSKLKLIRLDSRSYFLDYVPIALNGWSILIISIGTFILCMISLTIPSSIIARIQPSKTIKVE